NAQVSPVNIARECRYALAARQLLQALVDALPNAPVLKRIFDDECQFCCAVIPVNDKFADRGDVIAAQGEDYNVALHVSFQQTVHLLVQGWTNEFGLRPQVASTDSAGREAREEGAQGES